MVGWWDTTRFSAAKISAIPLHYCLRLAIAIWETLVRWTRNLNGIWSECRVPGMCLCSPHSALLFSVPAKDSQLDSIKNYTVNQILSRARSFLYRMESPPTADSSCFIVLHITKSEFRVTTDEDSPHRTWADTAGYASIRFVLACAIRNGVHCIVLAFCGIKVKSGYELF